MKVVVVGLRGFPNIQGGIETHCEELYPRLASLGEEVTVVRRKGFVREQPVRTSYCGVRFKDIAAPSVTGLEAAVHSLRGVWYAWRSKADIVHIHAIGPSIAIPLAKILGLRVVMTHHGPDYDRDKWGAVAKAMLRLGERMGCMFADDVIVISDVIRDIIRRKYGRTRRVHLIYNGVSEPELCDCPEYFKELGIEKGRYILGMCRFVPEKNLHHLVSAYAQIKNYELRVKKDSGIKLVLAGDADFEDGYSRCLKQMAKDNGVVLTGFIKGRRLHSLLSNCRCFCLPSSHEGLPIALLEAMSYGARVVVSDIPANLEVGLDSECYFPVGNVDALAARLRNVAERPFARVSYDMSRYDWNRIARQVAEVYNGLDR